MAVNNKSTALTVRKEITPSIWAMVREIAPAIHQCRFYGVANPEQAIAIMLKGFELGLGLASSFEYIQVVEGKPGLKPVGALALILNSPLLDDIKIEDGADYCQVTMKRRGGMSYTVRWTMADAIKAGVVKPGSGWEKYASNMLRWRAIGFCADVVFPDVIGGLKRADEYGADLTPDGDVIQAEFKPAPPAAVPDVPPLDALISTYGVDAILAANDGKVPGSEAELASVAGRLGAA